jgi:hypothetical protein
MAVVLPGDATDVSLFQFHAIPAIAVIKRSWRGMRHRERTLQSCQLDGVASQRGLASPWRRYGDNAVACCKNKSRRRCAAADGHNWGRGGFRRCVDYTVRHELVGGECAGLVEQAVCDFAREGDAEGLDAHDADLQGMSSV